MGNLEKLTVHLFFVCSVPVIAQERISLGGKIQSGDGDVGGTNILNITSDRASITDDKGFFSIPVRLNDTLIFSAVQYKRKELVVNLSVLESTFLYIFLEDALTELDEVIVRPYNLSGELGRDVENGETEPVVTASTLELPNAYVIPKTQAERKLYTARTWEFRGNSVKIDPVINYFSGRTRRLKERVAREARYDRIQRFRKFFNDALYISDLGIPKLKINEFIDFCEIDPNFQKTFESSDYLRIWEFLQLKSVLFKMGNDLGN